MDRPTNKIKTPAGKEAELKTYLTARERNQLRSVFLEGVNITPETSQPKIGDLSGTLLEKAEQKLLELALVSYDGAPENAIERLLDASPEEYDFVVAEANKIGNFKQAK
ncbi:MAG: hypothetical protein HY456_00145 [Parcubacteria group bacterium]|nr:hypothetical protein [Parcubacteria group bacterium]